MLAPALDRAAAAAAGVPARARGGRRAGGQAGRGGCRWTAAERSRASAALAGLARSRFSWEAVAEGVIAAAQGRLDELPEVPSDTALSDAPLG